MIKRVDEAYLAKVREESGEDVAALCKVVSDFLNDIEDRVPSFQEELDRMTELVAPFGLLLGDSVGGFATGTKWYDNDKSLWVRWNTWHNFFSVIVYKNGTEKLYVIYSNKLIDRIEAEYAEIKKESL